MRKIEDLAVVSVARGCGFGAIGIFTFMVGLSDEMAIAFKAGGILTLGMCLILLAKAWSASSVYHKRTELWLMMPAHERPPSAVAQQVIGSALRQVYLRFALHSAIAAIGMLLASFAMRLLR